MAALVAIDGIFVIFLMCLTYEFTSSFPRFDQHDQDVDMYNFGPVHWGKMRMIEKITKLGKRGDVESSWHVRCMACKFSAKSLQFLIHHGAKEDTIANLASSLCKKFDVYPSRVCDGLAQVYKDEVLYVFRQVSLNPADICSTIVDQDCGSSTSPGDNWTVSLPDVPKPPVEPVRPPRAGSPVLRVLHLSDIHYDPNYKEGAIAACGEPLCCREMGPNPIPPELAAGPWGDYRLCDTPLQTIENVLKHISTEHKIDYILWTGDDPPHNIWNQQREEQMGIISKVADLIDKHFPDTPVLPALGNHEGIPVNSFPPSNVSTSMDWLYELLGTLWIKWLPPETRDTVRTGGFYSTSPFPGLRIVSLNMNFCNNMNWWLLLNTTDPLDELQWLVKELNDAEAKGEKVHIIGHIPPGVIDCLHTWSQNYDYIINRYESTIRGQFFGHTHMDAFEVFYNSTGVGKRPVSVAYLGPSITTYSMSNPAYRIYTIDGNYSDSTWAVLDHETYYFDVKEANTGGSPVWHHLYSAKETYNLTSLQPDDWSSLILKLEVDDYLFQQFYRNYHQNSSAMPVCDKQCKQKILCELENARSHDNMVCRNSV